MSAFRACVELCFAAIRSHPGAASAANRKTTYAPSAPDRECSRLGKLRQALSSPDRRYAGGHGWRGDTAPLGSPLRRTQEAKCLTTFLSVWTAGRAAVMRSH